MKEKIFLDNDVILDISIKREIEIKDSVRIMSLVEENKYKGFTSSIVFINTYYI
ncbi:MAG: hypothetical protein LBT79_01605 [Elusimicrobiota bacterium]|jgi:hypothetical protein|nr:hypothetical protein [Elusimicrobiota bacterium]